jgi:hypothetical protein
MSHQREFGAAPADVGQLDPSGAAVRVLLRADPQTLDIEVANGPATAHTALTGAGTGNGLRGLLELLAETGGSLDAGATPDGGWLVTAQLPRSGVQLATHARRNPAKLTTEPRRPAGRAPGRMLTAAQIQHRRHPWG